MDPSDTIYVIDASLSMGKGYADFRPNKLAAVVSLISKVAMLKIQVKKDRVGIVVFYGLAFPVLPPTENAEAVMRSLSLIMKTGEGSALGDAIIEAAKLLRGSHRRKEIIVLSDGDLNMGAPLELAILFAVNTGSNLCIITIGQREKIKISTQLAILTKSKLIEWRHVENVREALANLFECSGVQP